MRTGLSGTARLWCEPKTIDTASMLADGAARISGDERPDAHYASGGPGADADLD
jgi:hypothetical protein